MDCSFNNKQEDLLLDFIRDNPMLWNVKVTDYRRKDKKEKLWSQQAELMNRSPENLKSWFRSLRDTHTREERTEIFSTPSPVQYFKMKIQSGSEKKG